MTKIPSRFVDGVEDGYFYFGEKSLSSLVPRRFFE
jgi:hypothetical protein